MGEDFFETSSEPIAQRVVTALVKASVALKSQAWQQAEEQGLTPTQSQILLLLQLRSPRTLRLSEVAQEMAISLATLSEAVNTLVQKGFVQKGRAQGDGRARELSLTEAGKREANQAAQWSDFLLDAVTTLPSTEQTVFLRVLIKMIRALQEKGHIPISHMCVTCRFFHPHAYPSGDRPHYCALVQQPFGDRHLRLECPEHELANKETAQNNWERFTEKGLV